MRSRLARFLKPILLSVIFGALIGFARYQLPIYSPAENRPGITASQFVNLVHTDPSGVSLQGMTASKFASLLRPHGADAVRDLTIYPTLNGKNYVRGTIVLSPKNLKPFQFNANNPFEFGPAVSGHDIRDFLAKECPKLSYRYAWWDSSTAQAGIWGASSTLVLSVVFVVASLFVSGGEKGAEISLFDDSKAAAPTPAATAPAPDLSKVEALNAMLEQSLGATAEPTANASTAEAADAPVPSLSNIPDPTAAPKKKPTPRNIAANITPSLSVPTARSIDRVGTQPTRRIGRLTVTFNIPILFSPEQRQVLENAAGHCPVHKSIHPDVEMVIKFNWAK